MTRPRIRLRSRSMLYAVAAPVGLAAIVALNACSGTSAPPPAAATAPTTSVASSASSVGGSVKVNANTASQDEVQQALTADGVANPARWAREVVEYRPYPTDDPSFGKLRQELAKYNPSPETVDQIVAALTL